MISESLPDQVPAQRSEGEGLFLIKLKHRPATHQPLMQMTGFSLATLLARPARSDDITTSETFL